MQEDTLDSAALLELDKQIISLTDEISALRHDNQKLNQGTCSVLLPRDLILQISKYCASRNQRRISSYGSKSSFAKSLSTLQAII